MKRLLIFISFFPFTMNAQDLDVEAISLEGTVFFVYEKGIFSESYYFIDNYILTKHGKYSLIDNYSSAEKTLELCGDVNGMLRFAIAQREESYELIESSFFRSKAVFNSGKHFGGDIYEVSDNNNRLIISYRLSAYGIAINSECPALDHPLLAKENHCDFIDNEDSDPVFLITNIIRLSPLNEEDVERNHLKRSKLQLFSAIYCE